MKTKSYNIIPFVRDLSDKDLADLRARTDAFLKKDMSAHHITSLASTDHFANPYLTKIPHNLLVLPDFQTERVKTNAGHVAEIIAQFDPLKATPAYVVKMTTGQYAGLLAIVDGHHITTAMKILHPDQDMPCFVMEQTESEAILMFAQQHQGTKNLSQRTLMLARLSNANHKADDLTIADHFIVDTFRNLFQTEFIDENNTIQRPIRQFEAVMVDNPRNINPKLKPFAEERLKWVATVYMNAGVPQMGGEQAHIVEGIDRTYSGWLAGCFGDLSEVNLTASCIHALRNECSGSINTKMCAIMERDARGMAYALPNDVRVQISEWLRYNVCHDAGIDWHLNGLVKNGNKLTQLVVVNGVPCNIGSLPQKQTAKDANPAKKPNKSKKKAKN